MASSTSFSSPDRAITLSSAAHVMAQAVFEDHPLAEYLRSKPMLVFLGSMLTCKDAGEIGELMPGTSFELQTEFDPFINTFPTDEDDLEALAEWRPRLLIELLDVCTVSVYCQVPLIVSIPRSYMPSSNSYSPPCRPTRLWSGSSTTLSHPRYCRLLYRHPITAP